MVQACCAIVDDAALLSWVLCCVVRWGACHCVGLRSAVWGCNCGVWWYMKLHVSAVLPSMMPDGAVRCYMVQACCAIVDDAAWLSWVLCCVVRWGACHCVGLRSAVWGCNCGVWWYMKLHVCAALTCQCSAAKRDAEWCCKVLHGAGMLCDSG